MKDDNNYQNEVNPVDVSSEDLDEQLKMALKNDACPEPQLNYRLMEKVNAKEAERSVSLWYLPALVNTLFFGITAVLAGWVVPIGILSKIIVGGCLYGIAGGILLTFAGVHYANLKQNLKWKIKKEGTV